MYALYAALYTLFCIVYIILFSNDQKVHYKIIFDKPALIFVILSEWLSFPIAFCGGVLDVNVSNFGRSPFPFPRRCPFPTVFPWVVPRISPRIISRAKLLRIRPRVTPNVVHWLKVFLYLFLFFRIIKHVDIKKWDQDVD